MGRTSASWCAAAVLLWLSTLGALAGAQFAGLSGGSANANLLGFAPLVGSLSSLQNISLPFLLGNIMGNALGGRRAPFSNPPPDSLTLCRMRGYSCERHTVQTEDGYLLTVIRVPGKPGSTPASTPVFLQHGMLASSDSWMFKKSDNLAFLLHDAGYDVWVGNYRGNTNSRGHIKLSVKDRRFWEFSWHELGRYDLSAAIDYVLQKTGFDSLQYIGHSMGCTGMVVLLSTRPEYNRKVRLVSLMAPATYQNNGYYEKSPLYQRLSDIAGNIKRFIIANKVWEVLPFNPFFLSFANAFCLDGMPTASICTNIGFELFGTSPTQTIPDLGPSVLAYTPAGTTMRIMEHYYEVGRSGHFRPLGKGYGDPNPGPDYNISAVTAPVAIYYASNDLLVNVKDIDLFTSKLPNLVRKYLVPVPTFNHVDFMWGRDARKVVFEPMFSTMQSFENRGVSRRDVDSEHQQTDSQTTHG